MANDNRTSTAAGADDIGYADLGCFGSGTAPGALPAVSTPNIDNMAAEGVKFKMK